MNQKEGMRLLKDYMKFAEKMRPDLAAIKVKAEKTENETPADGSRESRGDLPALPSLPDMDVGDGFLTDPTKKVPTLMFVEGAEKKIVNKLLADPREREDAITTWMAEMDEPEKLMMQFTEQNNVQFPESSFSKVSNLTWSDSLMNTVVNGSFVGSNVTTDIENITTETTVTSEETVSSAQEFWVVYVTATLPYILLTVVFIRGLTLDGAVDGIIVYLTPDFKKLLTAQVWVEAAIQVFYSLGPAWGGIITMSSYNKFHQKSLWSTVIVVVSDGFTAFYGGLVVFTVLGSMAKRLGVPVLDVAAASGPGLAFVVYPEAISTLPIPQFWAVLFFVTMVTMGIDTEFGMFETVTSALIDFFPGRLAAYRTTVTLVTAVSICILGIPFTCNGGVYLFQLCDWYFAAFALFLGASLETIMVCWIYGADRFSRDIEMMTGRKTSVVVRLLWCVICTFVLLVALVISLTQYSTPDYGDGYVYPVYGIVVGNIIAILPLLPLVGAIVWQIIRVQGSLIQRVKTLLRPTYHWQPNNNRCREIYKLKPYVYRRSFWQRMYTDLFGSKETPWF